MAKKVTTPRLAICNIFGQDAEMLADFAYTHGFQGIDWSIDLNISEEDFLRKMYQLKEFEVRYHCFFYNIDLAYADHRSEEAMNFFRHVIDLVSAASGKHITIHIGLGEHSSQELDWQKGIENLSSLVSFGSGKKITVSLENIINAWTHNPKLFKTLIKETGAGITFDIGHAHACMKDACEVYIKSYRDRVFNAHIYHTEIPRVGHIAPDSLDEIFDRLELLSSAPSCDWWVIELFQPDEILRTRDFLKQYIQLSRRDFEQPVANM
ncbi:MAG TPA: sugar phosphate isomerase/epimerase [Thermodesulfovibrionales bacterium]|nr:sugar phosphate isomerase/epimerase [Thermodesulfovibrionales bacterium]